MTWAKGVSGNVGGRPRGHEELRRAARIHTQAALNVLVAALRHKSVQARILAADKLLDRGWGRAVGDLGELGGGSITVIVNTGIDRTPLPQDVKAHADMQPISLEHEPAGEHDQAQDQGHDPLDVVPEPTLSG